MDSTPTEVNVAQFTSVRELFQVFQHVRDVSLTGVVPLVFFDEFDAMWERRAFGWLRYFLAPMQDGVFGSGPRRLLFGKAIFIFVGGLNHSFEMFNGRMHNREFIEAKGPDFVSRLARHLDVLGVDERSDDDVSYLIRRALLIRDKLWELHRPIIDTETGRAAHRLERGRRPAGCPAVQTRGAVTQGDHPDQPRGARHSLLPLGDAPPPRTA